MLQMRPHGVIHLKAEQMLSIVKPALGSPASQNFQRLRFNLLLQVAASNETIRGKTASEVFKSFPGRHLRKKYIFLCIPNIATICNVLEHDWKFGKGFPTCWIFESYI